MNSRRKFLQGTATTGIAAATLAAFPPSIRRALAIPAHHETGTIKDVKHVVILMQENRSFDHYFGTLHGRARLRRPLHHPAAQGRNVWQQNERRRPAGAALPPRRAPRATRSASSGTPHSWTDGSAPGTTAAWTSGRATRTPPSMGYYKEAECRSSSRWPMPSRCATRYHCSMHTGTNSNRMFIGPAPTARPARGRGRRRTTSGTRSTRVRAYGYDLDDLPRAAAGSQGELEGLPEHARQLRRQPAGRLQAVPRAPTRPRASR